MKLCVLFVVSFLSAQFLYGQDLSDTVVSKKYIDSLRRENADLRDKNNYLYWRNRLKNEVIKVDTVFVRLDSVDITFYVGSYSDNKFIPLIVKSVSGFNKDQVTDYIERFYNHKKQIVYIEYWNAIDSEVFDARLWKKERIDYDVYGRIVLSVVYLQFERRTIRTEISYDASGASHLTTKSVKGYSLWED